MRKFLSLLLFLTLLPAVSRAEIEIKLNADALSAGNELDIRVDCAGAVQYRYEVFSGAEQLVNGEFCPESGGVYIPRQPGDYKLRVTARGADGHDETAERTFSVSGIPSCQVLCDKESAQTGDALVFSVKTQSVSESCHYAYSIYQNNERIDYIESSDASVTYTARAEGSLKVEAAVTDERGNSASSALEIPVAKGSGITAQGDMGSFYSQGGIRTWIIRAPGIWTAKANDDFITLNNDCGYDGDKLTFSLQDNGWSSRSGSISIQCGAETVALPVIQSNEPAEEEDVWLFSENPDAVTLDGAERTTWLDASGERLFSVQASGEWEAQGDADFVTVQKESDALRLTVQENLLSVARSCKVTLTCGSAQAYAYVFQSPAPSGADVLEASTEASSGRAWQDTIKARVRTSSDAQALMVTGAGGQTASFARSDAKKDGNELLWTVDVPLWGGGEEPLLFAAENQQGAGKKSCVIVQDTPEDAGFSCAEAQLSVQNGQSSLTVRVTQATDKIEALDKSKKSIGFYTEKQAKIDRYVSSDNQGRYADWVIAVKDGEVPSFLRLGDSLLPVSSPHETADTMTVYDQCDGSWTNAPYRKSTLEQSGCAIFALAHALQVIGITGENTTPEALAEKYAFCLVDGGTLNSTLIGNAGNDLGFKTRYELFTNKNEVIKKLSQGAVFTFSVVSGHIAMVYELSGDQTMFHVVDSALSATFSRIKNAQMYRLDENGAFVPVNALSELSGAKYYIETNAYGGGNYWLEASYVLKRGLRRIQ